MAVHRGADLGDVRPRKPQRKRRSLLPRLPRFKHWRAVRRYGTRAVLWSAFAALMGGIVINATALQKGRHPAPLVNIPDPTPTASIAPPPRQPPVADEAPAPAPMQRAEAPAPQPVPAAVPAPARDGGARQMVQRPPGHAESGAGAKRAGAIFAAKPGPGQVRAEIKGEAKLHPRPTDRARLAAMITAAGKGHGPTAVAN